jgi:hypothetical protein
MTKEIVHEQQTDVVQTVEVAMNRLDGAITAFLHSDPSDETNAFETLCSVADRVRGFVTPLLEHFDSGPTMSGLDAAATLCFFATRGDLSGLGVGGDVSMTALLLLVGASAILARVLAYPELLVPHPGRLEKTEDLRILIEEMSGIALHERPKRFGKRRRLEDRSRKGRL